MCIRDRFKEADELDGDQKAFVEEYFEKVVFPVLTQMCIRDRFNRVR